MVDMPNHHFREPEVIIMIERLPRCEACNTVQTQRNHFETGVWFLPTAHIKDVLVGDELHRDCQTSKIGIRHIWAPWENQRQEIPCHFTNPQILIMGGWWQIWEGSGNKKGRKLAFFVTNFSCVENWTTGVSPANCVHLFSSQHLAGISLFSTRPSFQNLGDFATRKYDYF